MKRFFLAFVIAVLLFSFSVPVCAHPGNTDTDGGHYDYSDGEYHYHHGYPAHDHYDMDGDGDIDCPYGFDDKTGVNSGDNPSDTDSFTGHNKYTTPSSPSLPIPGSNTPQKEEVQETPMIIDTLLALATSAIMLAIFLPFIFVVGYFLFWTLKSVIMRLISLVHSEPSDRFEQTARIFSSLTIVVALYVLCLFPVVDYLISKPDTLAATLIVLGIIIFVLAHAWFYALTSSKSNHTKKQKQTPIQKKSKHEMHHLTTPKNLVSSDSLHLSPSCNRVSEAYLTEKAIEMGVTLIFALRVLNLERECVGLPRLNNTETEVNNYCLYDESPLDSVEEH